MIETMNSPATTVEDAVRRLVSARHYAAGSVVTMPVTYPSGASVALEITMQNGRCFVSDMGRAYDEADMMGTTRYFKSEATRIAESIGIKFDGNQMFVAEVPIDNVRGAMVVVANASSDAARSASNKQTERHEHDEKEALYYRLSALYRAKSVSKDAQLVGPSNHSWKISVLVQDQLHTWMFEPVSGHYITAVGTAAKFHDFAMLENPPSRISVIKSQADMGDYYGLVVAASTKVISANDSDANFIKVLEAA